MHPARLRTILLSNIALAIVLGGVLLSAPLTHAAGAVTSVNKASLTTTLKPTSNVVLVVFTLPASCDACKKLEDSGFIGALSTKYQNNPKVSLAKYVVPQAEKAHVTSTYKVTSWPTIKVFVNGDIAGATVLTPPTDYNNADQRTAKLSEFQDVINGKVTNLTSTPDPQSTCQKAVLIKLNPGECANTLTFQQYIIKLIDTIMPIILSIALLMIIFSGIQYMYSGLSGDSKAAKQRIIGVLTGVIFFLLMRMILNQIMSGIEIADNAPPAVAPQGTSTTAPNNNPPAGN